MSGIEPLAPDCGVERIVTPRLQSQVGYRLRRLSHLGVLQLTDALADIPVRPIQYSIMAIVEEQPDIPQALVARALTMTKGNLAALVTELEAQGYVRREIDATDRRIRRLRLSAEGAAKLTECHRRVIDHEQRFLAPLNQAERTRLLQLLEKLSIGHSQNLATDAERPAMAQPAIPDRQEPAIE